MLSALALATALVSAAVPAGELPHVNWENHPVHALDLAPDGVTLAVAHTADARVQLFDVRGAAPVPIGSVPVGLDPVSVRFRTADELWVINHISDSVSIVDVPTRTVIDVLRTGDEPADVVFAAGRAFVTISQENRIQVFAVDDRAAPPVTLPVLGEDPRALAVSDDGGLVFAAVFESGNASTVLGGGAEGGNRLTGDAAVLAFPPNVVSDPAGPWAGANPPPNEGSGFAPAIADELPTPPRVGLIVRKDAAGRWLDDNGGDWTDLVSGERAALSGRRPGWDLPDRDLVVIDAETLDVDYRRRLLTMGMSLAWQPGARRVTVVGTEARNEIRFEPNLNGVFAAVVAADVPIETDDLPRQVDLNPHVADRAPRAGQALRDRSLGDPRGIVWRSDGARAWVSGMGSNNVVPVDGSLRRAGAPIEVGEGPTGLALDEARGRLYAWNHFEASLSVIDLATEIEIDRVAVFDPLPAAIRAGRPLLYDTHRTSGLGQASCATCHVDGRTDRLAWDLGEPDGEMKAFDQNCITTVNVEPCEDFHPMKGPMATQTFQDIIGHEPFHWRGDRDGIEEFNGAFVNLLGDDRLLDFEEMQAFEDHLDTITFPPNPFRGLDNSLPRALDLAGHYTTGRFTAPGQPLPPGDAERGLALYVGGLLDTPLHCASCHTLNTGMAANGPLKLGNLNFAVGGEIMATGPRGENHLGIVSVDGSTNRSIKVPQLRNLYDKTGFDTTQLENTAGFGFLHDGSVDSLARFINEPVFGVRSVQETADLVALMLAFSGSDLEASNPFLGNDPPVSQDTHAAVGQQVVLPPVGDEEARLATLLAEATAGRIDLVARGGDRAWRLDAATGHFAASDGSGEFSATELAQEAGSAGPIVLLAVPAGLGERLAVDRDGDGIPDPVELRQGSNPADGADTTLRPRTGLWFDPARPGHGFDLQRVGERFFATWYTYDGSGAPTWYQASGPADDGNYAGELLRFHWPAGDAAPTFEVVGDFELAFEDARRATLNWRLEGTTGSESVERIGHAPGRIVPDRTGTWYDPDEPGWGVSYFDTPAERVAIVYYYDAAGAPRWALGQGPVNASTLSLDSYAGFCPACSPGPVTTRPAGQLASDFGAGRVATITLELEAPAGGAWNRPALSIVPLSDAAFDPSVY